MGLIGNISIRMSTNVSPFAKGLKTAGSSLNTFNAQIIQTSNLIRGAFAAALGGAGALAVGKMITGASDLAENVGKIGAIFGDQGKSVEADVRSMADAFGVSINGMLEGAGKLGGLFKGAGFDASATADLSKQFNRLTLDASRFFNVPYDVAFQKIRSGLAGEAEPLRDFGVFLTADKIKAQALSMGLAKLGDELTDQAKITATAAIISAGLADAQGNAAATADGAAAKIEEFRGRVSNLVVTLGEELAPIAGQALGGISTGIIAMTNLWGDSKAAVVDWASSTVDSAAATVGSLNVFEVAVGGIANGFQAVGIAWHAVQVLVIGGVAVTLEAFGKLGAGFDYLLKNVAGVQSGIGDFFKDLSKITGDLAEKQIEQVKAAWEKPWASNAISDQFQAARDQLKALRSEMSAIPKIVPAINAGAVPKKAKARDSFAGAQLAGSTEAASTILRTKYGAGKDGTAENTKRTADGIAQLVQVQRDNNRLLSARAAGLAVLDL
jgi:hypothetical protein